MNRKRDDFGRFLARVWTQEQDSKLKKLYPNNLTKDVADEMGMPISSVRNRAYFLGLKKDLEWIREISRKNTTNPNHPGRKFLYQKGRIPENKGKKQVDYMSPEMIERTKATRFQKNSIPHNSRPVGFERLDKDGYIYLKVSGKRKLVLKHRYVWEQHNGSIPEGCNIQFKDGNKHNCEIDNLYMINRVDQIRNNTIQRYPSEIKRAIRNISKLNKTIKDYEQN